MRSTFLLLAILAPAALRAQDPSPRDTAAPRDTAVRRDTTTADSTRRRAPVVLPTTSVTVTRERGRSQLDVPFALSVTRPDSLSPGQRHTQLDETLFLVPGVVVSPRANPSQDPRITVRGFGARSAFGVRDVRVLRDGLPLTLPDGQTPVDFLDLETVGRVEAIRGTASALYGNASGGVIDVRSAPPPDVPLGGEVRGYTGSDGINRTALVLGGVAGRAWYQGDVAHSEGNGVRSYAHERLTTGYARAGVDAGGTTYTVQALALDEPLAQSPGALTRAALDSSPDAADPLSVRKQARKVVRQLLLGAGARHPFGEGGEVSALVYGGNRALFNPLTYAIVDVGRRQDGGGARATLPFALGPLPSTLTAGVDLARQSDLRRNRANCNGLAARTATCPQGAAVEEGNLSLDQREIVSSVGPYARLELALGPRVRVSGGVRDDQVRFQVRDYYLADWRDDSGERTLGAVSPMFGIVARVAPLHSLYADLSTSFDTPTSTELGTKPDGSGGLNPDLGPQRATTGEVGMKGIVRVVQYDVALFTTGVRDELIPYQVPKTAGRSYYRNAGRTSRRGAELSALAPVGPLELGLAYSVGRFRFTRFLESGASYAGNAIPGVPASQLQASATWRHGPAFATVEGSARSRVYVNDANSAWAPAAGWATVRVGALGLLGRPWISPVLGVQNVTDTRYASAVVVNASGASLAATPYYEPAPRRTLFVGLGIGAGR